MTAAPVAAGWQAGPVARPATAVLDAAAAAMEELAIVKALTGGAVSSCNKRESGRMNTPVFVGRGNYLFYALPFPLGPLPVIFLLSQTIR